MNKISVSFTKILIRTRQAAFKPVLVAIAAIAFFAPYHASAVSVYPSTPSIISPASGVAAVSPVTFSGTCDPDTSVSVSGFGSSTVATNCSTIGGFSLSIASSTADGAQSVTATATNLGWATTTPALNFGYGAYNFAANGYLYSAGGGADPSHNATAEETYLNRAQINGDGTLGAWSTAGTAYDGYGQFFGGGAYVNGKIFIIGGIGAYGYSTLSRIISYTLSTSTNSITNDGYASTSLPAPQWQFSLAQNGNFIYTIGGMDSGFNPTNAVYFTQVDADGTMHAWQSTTPLPVNRVAASSFVLNGKLYVLGGRLHQWGAAVNTSSVFHATISGDGSLGAWTQDADLPFSFSSTFPAGNSMHILNGYIYALGTGDNATSTKYAQIQSDYSFGPWQDGPDMVKFVSSQTVEYGGNFYAMGMEVPDYSGLTVVSDNTVQRSSESMLRYGGSTSSSTALSFSIDNTVPTLASSWIDGQTLTLNYSKALRSQAPATSTYAVFVDSATSTVSSVQIIGGSVILTLDAPAPSGHVAILSYAVPGSNPVQDNLNHLASSLSSITVSPPPSGGFSTTYVTEGNTTYSIKGGVKAVFSTSNVNDLWFQDYKKRSGFSLAAATTTATTTVQGGARDGAQNTAAHPASAFTFTKDLSFGMSGPEALLLQRYLNSHGFIVSVTGAGSPGNETSYFGSATRSAVVRFQKASNVTPAVGYFGPKSRAAALAGK
jgi:hypothetical protein